MPVLPILAADTAASAILCCGFGTLIPRLSEVLDNNFFMPLRHMRRWRSGIKKLLSSTSNKTVRSLVRFPARRLSAQAREQGAREVA